MRSMMAKIFLLCISISITGCNATPTDVSKSVGSSVQLNIHNKVLEFEDLSWKHNIIRVLKYVKKSKDVTLYDPYQERLEFNMETYSLTLKNLQKTDSGLYKAIASGQVDSTVAEYRVTVFEPEHPVFNNETIENCTITCRGHDLTIISNCSKKTCEEKKQTSSGGFTLSLSVRGSSLICIQNNEDSREKAEIDMKYFRHCGENNATSHLCPGFLWPALGSVIIIIQSVLAII